MALDGAADRLSLSLAPSPLPLLLYKRAAEPSPFLPLPGTPGWPPPLTPPAATLYLLPHLHHLPRFFFFKQKTAYELHR